MPDIDALDRALLAMLRANARSSAATLGRALRLPRTTVSARIARLERLGVIAGYGLRLGGEHRPALAAVIGIKVAPKSASTVATSLAELPEVESLHALSGEFDLLAHLHLNAPSELEDWLAKVGNMEGVTELHTSIVLSTKLDRRSIG